MPRNIGKQPPPPPPMPETVKKEAVAAETQETTVAKPAPAPAPSKAASSVRRFRAAKFPIHNSYQRVTVPITHAVPLEVDNWVQVQLAAGVIIEE